MDLDLIKERSEEDVRTLNKNTKPIMEEKTVSKLHSHISSEKKRKKNKSKEASESLRIRNKLDEPQKKAKGKANKDKDELEMKVLSNTKGQSLDEEGKVLGVIVHNAECLKMDFHVLHPSVKIFLVDASTGNLIRKSSARRKVTSYYEGEHVQIIVPCMTQPYEFKKRKSVIPRWEEVILFNEKYEYLKSFSQNLILFFLIQDFVSMNATNNHQGEKSGGWYHIAWAFLKLFPSKDRSNASQKLRLQLYKPPKRKKNFGKEAHESSSDGVQIVWKWWNEMPHVVYSSTLFVTVQPIDPPNAGETSAALRSLVPTQPEIGISKSESTVQPSKKDHLWSRIPGQSCKIPKHVFHEIEEIVSCSGIEYSRDGRWLAVACSSQNSYSIKVFDALSAEHQWTLKGHAGYIYQLNWNADSSNLLSASGDGTVKIWKRTIEIHRLEHPTYVYCARFHPTTDDVATAGFDKVVRIWSDFDETGYIVLRELLGHTCYITALEFDIEGQVLFTGDNEGFLRVWESFRCEREGTTRWHQKKVFELSEIKRCRINDLQIHPGGRRLLIHSRSVSNALLVIDLRLGSIMQKYSGSQSFGGMTQTRCCITPCGSYIFAGSQDGAAYVWNTDTGERMHIYANPFSLDKYSVPVCSVSYHPLDHYFAFGSSSASAPVMIYKFMSDKPDAAILSPPITKKEEYSTILQKMEEYLHSRE